MRLAVAVDVTSSAAGTRRYTVVPSCVGGGQVEVSQSQQCKAAAVRLYVCCVNTSSREMIKHGLQSKREKTIQGCITYIILAGLRPIVQIWGPI